MSMSNTEGWHYKRGKGLIKPQPDELEEQYGSSTKSVYEKRWKVKGT